jgi:hypothetical protein
MKLSPSIRYKVVLIATLGISTGLLQAAADSQFQGPIAPWTCGKTAHIPNVLITDAVDGGNYYAVSFADRQSNAVIVEIGPPYYGVVLLEGLPGKNWVTVLLAEGSNVSGVY